jgi:alpha-glucosidase
MFQGARRAVGLLVGLGAGALAVVSLAVLAHASATVAAAPAAIRSPNGRVAFAVQADSDGRLRFSVSFGGRPVIEPSPLVLTVDGADLARGTPQTPVAIGRVESYRTNTTFPWRGVHATAVDRSNGVRITIAAPAPAPSFVLDVRVFDAGVAFRQLVPGGGARVPDERTSFIVPAGSTVWYHDFENHYESTYAKKDIAAVQAGEWAAPPVTIQLPADAGFAAITEGGLARYSGMGLQAAGERAFEVRLGHAQPLNYPFKLRYGEDEGKRLAGAATVEGPIATPWRVILVGADLDALVNADVLQAVSAPADPALFPRGLLTEWVKPGRSLWRYLDGGDNSFEGMKEYSRMAGELGFEYNLLEGFWQKWPESQLRELVDYSRSRGVGIWLWKHSRDLRTPETRGAFFALCQRVGIVGAKIDFFDHEHKEIVELYEVLSREAAEHKVMVNYHGANKPTGEARTWPNELTREAVYGFERSKTPAWAVHNTTLPFTRYLAGPADYTPVVFGDRRRETSWPHQIASAAIFTSPLLVYGAHPASLLEHPAVEMIKSLPATWDETRVLAPSAIGEAAVFARRRGETWFLAIMNGSDARTIRTPLAFLGKGTWDSLLVKDRAENAAAVDLERATADARTTLTIVLRAGGGFVGRFTRKSSAGAQERRSAGAQEPQGTRPALRRGCATAPHESYGTLPLHEPASHHGRRRRLGHRGIGLAPDRAVSRKGP